MKQYTEQVNEEERERALRVGLVACILLIDLIVLIE